MSLRTLTTFLVAIAISLTTQTAFAQRAVTTPPVANNDSAPTTVNTPVDIPVLANDTPAIGNPIDPKSVKVARAPSNGVATALSNGQVRYTPKTGFTGTDTFTYTVKGIRGTASNAATVTVNVPPVANNDSASTSVNTLVNIPVLANDTDANGNATINPTTVVVSDPPSGTAVSKPDETVHYTPDSGFFGTDSFTYTVKDNQNATSNTATVTVGVNAAPVANAGPDQNAVTGASVVLNGSASSDPNNDTLTFSWVFLNFPGGSPPSIVNPDMAAPSFTPDVDGVYTLELTVTDTGGLTDTDTVDITATTANVAPNADGGPNQNADLGQTVNLNGSASDDPDDKPNATLTYAWTFTLVPTGSGLDNDDSDDTDLTGANTATPSFTPDLTGLYRLTLTVSDGDLLDSADVDINVTTPNVPPNARAGDDFTVQLGNVATLNGTQSNDPDNGPVSPLTFEWTFVTVTSLTITDADLATASFTPDVAGVYVLQLCVSDGTPEVCDQVMVKANAAPVAVDDAFDVDEDTPLLAAPGVLTNDTDANNDALTAVLDTGPSDAASFTLNPDGSFDYTPNPDFSGEDSFTYHANDDGANGGNGADSNVATVTITVTEVNDAPVANDDGGPTFTTNEDGGPFAGPSVLTNDTDPEDDPLTAVLNTGPTNASAFTLNPDGTFSYTPNADFFGDDTFTYHATDGNTPNPDSNVATVTITVNAVNDAPSFTASNPPTVLEDAGTQTVSGFATFSPGPANESGQTVLGYSVSNVTNPALFSGSPAVAANGTLTYTPAANANGSSTFDVVVQDSGGTANGGVDTSSPAQTFTITVLAVNDAPVATDKFHQTHSGIRITIGAGDTGKLKDGATDVDDPFGDLAVSASFSASTPAGATITLTDAATGTFTFNPPAGVSGPVTFQFQVCDDGSPTPPAMCSAPATVRFNVTGANNVADAGQWFVQQGASGTGRLTDPFGSLASLPTGRGSNGRIFVFTGTYATGLTLLTGEHLIGQGSSGAFDTVLGVQVPGNGTLDTRPTLAGTLAARPQLNGTVTVGGGSTVRGLNIASTTATGLAGGAVAGVTVSEASVTSTTGTAVNLNGTPPPHSAAPSASPPSRPVVARTASC